MCIKSEFYGGFISDGTDICEVRWNKEEGFSCFSKQFGYRPLVGNYKKMWWADLKQTIHNVPRFRLQK